MIELLEEIVDTLNSLPNRKIKGKDYTTYNLVKRVEQKLEELKFEEEMLQDYKNQILKNS